MEPYLETMIAHRAGAIALLKRAVACADTHVAAKLKNIIKEWDRLLAQYGVKPEGPEG